LKSNASDYLELVQVIYIDACSKCIADVSDLRDIQTLISRVKDEGLSFLTITLPQFCRDFERSLAEGIVDSTFFLGFKKNGSIPAFLQGMTSQIFDRETGRILYDEVENCPTDIPIIIDSVRQICLAFKKIELDCTLTRVAAAVDNFVSIERSFDTFSLSDSARTSFTSTADVLWGPMVSTIVLSQCTPKHGPGTTAEGITGNSKYSWQYWYDRLEPYFPLVDNGYPMGISSHLEELQSLTIVPETSERPVRVVLVPKTLKSPRVIAIEPCCMQFVQQGIRSALYEKIESNWLSSGHVNFRDQSINQELAMTSSMTGQLATIDLSDASDRVPHDLAMEMFRSNPVIQDAIEACRSTKAELPDGRIISPLRKFASMGSALCFPVEAMYFYTICVVAILKEMHLPVTSRNCFKVSRDVYVYGDDIIVPRAYAIVVLEHLQQYNCKVNANKTFVNGSFRESCGEDAFLGERVTPVYVGKDVPKNKRDADRLISWTAAANSFYKKGYWRTATFLFNKLERILGPLPYVLENSPALGRISYLGYRSAERWNRFLQRFEMKAWVPSPVYRTDRLEGYGALMKSFLGGGRRENDDPMSQDARHLERSALHGAVVLIRRWVPSDI